MKLDLVHISLVVDRKQDHGLSLYHRTDEFLTSVQIRTSVSDWKQFDSTNALTISSTQRSGT